MKFTCIWRITNPSELEPTFLHYFWIISSTFRKVHLLVCVPFDSLWQRFCSLPDFILSYFSSYSHFFSSLNEVFKYFLQTLFALCTLHSSIFCYLGYQCLSALYPHLYFSTGVSSAFAWWSCFHGIPDLSFFSWYSSLSLVHIWRA